MKGVLDMIFQVRGTTVITNQQIQVPVEAESQSEALSIVFHQYGKLRFDLDIYVESFMEPEDYPDAAPLNRLVPSLSDDEVIGISQAICDNLATREDYEAFCHYFKPLIKRQIYDLWRDMTEITASDMESDLITAIATEFMPRFDPTRGPLRLFIRLNIQSRLIKLWNREKYIGEDKTRTRADALKEYARMHSYPEERLDPDEKRAYVIGLAHRLSRTNEKMKIKDKREFFRIVLELRMHQEYLDSEEQKDALLHCYGMGLTEAQHAERTGRSQPTVHINKARAERNIMEYIVNNFMEE